MNTDLSWLADLAGISSIPAICGIVFMIIIIYKSIFTTERAKTYVPAIAILAGAVLGVVVYFTAPQLMLDVGDVFSAICVGGVSGSLAIAIHQVGKQAAKRAALKTENGEVANGTDETNNATQKTEDSNGEV